MISHNRFEGASQVDTRRVTKGMEIVSIVGGLRCLSCLSHGIGQ